MPRIFAISLVVSLVAAISAPAAEIHDAIRANDVVRVTAILDRDPSQVEARTPNGLTPLHYSAAGGATETTRLLLDRGAGPNAQTPTGKAALHFAVQGKHVEILRMLVSAKANLEITDGYGRTPLLIAAREMAGVDVVRTLLDLGANVHATDTFGSNSLALAAWRGSGAVVDLLLERGARIPGPIRDRRQLLQEAVANGLDSLFFRLLDDGADLADDSLVAAAAEGGSVAILEATLARGLDVNHRDENGWTPLHFATDLGRLGAIELLLSKGADLHARTLMGETALDLAGYNDDEQTLALLAARGLARSAVPFPQLSGPYLGQKRPGRKAEVFAIGIVSSHYGLHSTPSFSPDGKEVFWSVMLPPRGETYSPRRTLVSRVENGRWTLPRQATFAQAKLDDVPFHHPAGDLLFEMALRPIPGSEGEKENIWVWKKTASGWASPAPLDQSVNSVPLHWQFSVDRRGDLYLSTSIPGSAGESDLYVSRFVDGHYQQPQNLGAAVNTTAREEMPYVSPDGRTLLFSRNMDIWVSFLTANGSWTTARRLGPEVNTRGMELLPILSPDGKFLFFSRDHRCWWIDATVVEELRATELARVGRRSGVQALEDAISSGDVAAARARFEAMRGPEAAAFFFDEAHMVRLGNALLTEQRKPQEAEAVFEMATIAFPASWRAWEGLGRARSLRGDRTAAIAHFKKSLELNPANESVRGPLGQLEGHALDEARETREPLRWKTGATIPLRGPWLGQEPPGRNPKVFAPGIVSTAGAYEFSITFTPDGNECYFTRRAEGGENTLMVSRQGPEGWSAPEEAAFARGFTANEPHVTPDGKRLYFGSPRGEGGIWFVERTADGGWGEARHHGAGMYASTSLKGDVYLTDIGSFAGGVNVQPRSGERFGWPRRLGGGVNSPSPANHGFIAPDESYILFDSYFRAGGQGGEGDLWVSFRKPDGSWSDALNLGDGINTPATNFCPMVTPDGRYIFYSTNRDIYWVSAAVIEELRGVALGR